MPTIAGSGSLACKSSTLFCSAWAARLFFYRPDGAVLERLEWRTDVLTAFDGTEQRVKIRSLPRRSFEYAVTVSGADRRRMEAALFQWQGRAFAVPVWMDGELLASPVSAGGFSVPADTATRDYHAGGLAILLSSPNAFEIVEIDTVEASSLTLARALVSSWPVGAEVYPVRICYVPDEVRLGRFTGDTAYGRMRFDVDEASEYAAASETLYRAYPVLELAPNWVQDIEQTYAIKRSTFDPGVGRQFREIESNVPALVQTHRWLLDGRAELGGFREWLYARAGRLSAFWLPTWAQDLELVATVGSSALTIDVAHCDYTDRIAQGIGRRDIRIETSTGTVYYRRIASSTEVSASVERLTIDSALGAALAPSDVRAISYMALARLDADAAEISWSRWDLGEAALNIRSARNDL